MREKGSIVEMREMETDGRTAPAPPKVATYFHCVFFLWDDSSFVITMFWEFLYKKPEKRDQEQMRDRERWQQERNNYVQDLHTVPKNVSLYVLNADFQETILLFLINQAFFFSTPTPKGTLTMKRPISGKCITNHSNILTSIAALKSRKNSFLESQAL